MTTLFKTIVLTCALALCAGAQTEVGSIWTGDRQKLYDYLKAQGAPDYVIFMVLKAHDSPEVGKQRLAILYPEGLTRWSGQSREDKIVAKVNDLYQSHHAELRRIMGPSLDLAIARNDQMTMFMWGDLTDTEVVNMRRLQDQYDRIMAYEKPYSGLLHRKALEWDTQFNDSYERDVRRILGPKAEDFITFNAPIARMLKDELTGAGVKYDEATYRRVLAETRNLRSELMAHIDEYSFADMRRKQVEMYQVVLGSDAALAIAVANDTTFKNLNAIAEGEPGQRLEFFYEYLRAMDRLGEARGTELEPSPETIARIKAERTRFFAIIQANVPAPKLEGFMQTREGLFLKGWR